MAASDRPDRDRRRRNARRVVEHAATVAASAMANAQDQPPLPDPEEDTNHPADVDSIPPPPLPPAFREPPKPPPVSSAISGIAADGEDAPDDPLAGIALLHRMLVVSAIEAANDGDMTPRERRKELRTISVAANALLPRSRLYQAEQTVMGDRAKLEKKQAARARAKLTPRPGKQRDPDFGDP